MTVNTGNYYKAGPLKRTANKKDQEPKVLGYPTMNVQESNTQHDPRFPQHGARSAMTPKRPLRPQKEIDAAVRRVLVAGEQVDKVARDYNVSRAGLYLWIRKARDQATENARLDKLGPKGAAIEDRISKDMRIKHLEQELRQTKEKLFEMMLKHKEI